jgi:methyl-accepting chemotaxis protein
MNMSINRSLFIGIIVIGVLTAGITTIGGVMSGRLGEDLEHQRLGAGELRLHTQADMYSDALRGDVYRALFDAKYGAQNRDEVTRLTDEHSKLLNEKVTKSEHISPELVAAARSIEPAIEAYNEIAKQIVNQAYTDYAGAQAQLPAFNKSFIELNKLMTKMGDQIQAEIDQIEEHAQVDRRNAQLASIGGGLTLLVALIAGFLMLRRLVIKPLDVLRASLSEKIVGPELKKLTERHQSDEIGELARSMVTFKTASREATRIRTALDTAPSSMMMADLDHNIIFMNQSATKLMNEHVSDFRQAIPSFDPDKIIGSNMSVFQRNPAHQDAMVAHLNGAQTSRVKFGARTFDFTVSTVSDEDGQRLGALLEWRDLTVEQAAQDEVGAVVLAAADGDFSKRVPLEGKSGFLREIAKSMNELGTMIDKASTEFAETISSVAKGDLTRSVTSDYKGRFGDLKNAINETTSKLAQLVRTIQSTTLDVAASAKEITSGSDDLSQRTESQAASLEETAATTEELAASVKASAQASRQAVSLADEAMKVAINGGDIVKQAVDAMARIEQASRKISDITGVIDEIAFQTNLLALNAAVEAARAGDAGKGFAVVASEVRSLAQRSSEAAKDISGLIQSSTGEVSQGVQLVRSAGDALHEIVEASSKVSGTVSEISTAASEQANGIDEMSQTVAQMDEMTQQNAALAEQSAASAVSLNDQISRLNALVATFRTGPDSFGDAASSSRGVPEPERRRRMAQAAFSPRAGSNAA